VKKKKLARQPIESVEFTKREIEVLDLLVTGKSYKLIAVDLFLSEHTTKFHIHNILFKLGADTKTEAAVLWALHREKQKQTARAVLAA
jgi:DNA-binding CsgD family transcriptional regulator